MLKYEVAVRGNDDVRTVDCQSVVDRHGFVDFLRVGSAGEWVIALRLQADSVTAMRLVTDEAATNGQAPAPQQEPEAQPAEAETAG